MRRQHAHTFSIHGRSASTELNHCELTGRARLRVRSPTATDDPHTQRLADTPLQRSSSAPNTDPVSSVPRPHAMCSAPRRSGGHIGARCRTCSILTWSTPCERDQDTVGRGKGFAPLTAHDRHRCAMSTGHHGQWWGLMGPPANAAFLMGHHRGGSFVCAPLPCPLAHAGQLRVRDGVLPAREGGSAGAGAAECGGGARVEGRPPP